MLSVALCSLLPFILSANALKLDLARVAAASSSVNNNLINKYNVRYTTNITISGRVVNVVLDTGSTDLWVMPPDGLPAFKDTGINTKIVYGNGYDYVAGDIGTGEFQLDSYIIPNQAFLKVNDASAAEQGDFQLGIYGVWGLGFNTPGSSRINDAVTQAYGSSATWGQSALANIFAQDPTKADYIAISLSRNGDSAGSADASLAIAEYDTHYTQVANAPRLSQSPPGSGSWTVTLDSISVGGKKLNWPTTLQNVPRGKNIVAVDTGTTNAMLPAAQIAAIYGSIPNAVFAANAQLRIPQTQYSSTTGVWVVPCTASISVSLTFGGQTFPIHPLDMTDIQIVASPDGKSQYTVCIGSFTDVGTIVSGFSDGLVGDSFLRNAYTVFDFATGGNVPPGTTPFVQMLSVTDATKAQADYLSVRRALLRSYPPELSPAQFVQIFG
ncbi:unnamed protein product [Mycena citricolor]|uniref:Peptidase A1 domain-containing protein n=1 Tax=Mycena citricolor TaxID=2018698 RepID=A0AAD2HDX4_9AGAR|nr:unnamed protein product [Mycena citricolor]CAK5272974.1 unnamed protein product [Mycena citricolor]